MLVGNEKKKENCKLDQELIRKMYRNYYLRQLNFTIFVTVQQIAKFSCRSK